MSNKVAYSLLLLTLNTVLGFYINRDYEEYDYDHYHHHDHDSHSIIKLYNTYLLDSEAPKQEDQNFENTLNDTVFENSKSALNFFLSSYGENKALFYSHPGLSQNSLSRLDENKILEFIAGNIVDDPGVFDNGIKQDSIEFLKLFQKILAKYDKKKNVEKMSPNFIKYLIFYLKNVLHQSNKLRINQVSIEKILQFLSNLETKNFNSNSTRIFIPSKSAQTQPYDGFLSANKLDEVIQTRLNSSNLDKKLDEIKVVLEKNTTLNTLTTTLPIEDEPAEPAKNTPEIIEDPQPQTTNLD